MALYVLFLFVGFGSGASAEEAPASPTPVPRVASFWVGARLGLFTPTAAAESWDAIYGHPATLAGIAAELRLGRRWFVALAIDRGRVEGEQVLPASPPVRTGVPLELTLTPLHLTAGWVARPESRWQVLLGGGPTLLAWEEDSTLGRRSRTDPGAHLLAAARLSSRRWGAGAELRWSTVPDAIGEGGLSRVYGEDDLGGLALHVSALVRLH